MLETSKLDKLPIKSKSGDLYIWADYIELLCITNPDYRISQADVQKHVWQDDFDDDVYDYISESAALSDGDDVFSDTDDETLFFLGETLPLIEPSKLSTTRERDINEEKVEQWFEQLRFRSRAFKDFYPFDIEHRTLVCRSNFKSNPKHRLYIFLLLASCFKYLSNSNEFAKYFEVVSMIAMKGLIGPSGKVAFVGTNDLNRGKYSGTKWHKIVTISEDIGQPIAPNISVDLFKNANGAEVTGDGGLDVMGLFKFDRRDSAIGKLIILAQCACGKDWEGKQYESHAIRWENFIHFSVKPNNFMFIPYCFRGADGDWYNPTKITQTILIDRLRLVHLLRNKLHVFPRFHPFDDLLNYTMQWQSG